MIDTEKGKAFVYLHGDHKHSTLISDIDTTKPFDPHADPHAHDKVGMATLKALGFDDEDYRRYFTCNCGYRISVK